MTSSVGESIDLSRMMRVAPACLRIHSMSSVPNLASRSLWATIFDCSCLDALQKPREALPFVLESTTDITEFLVQYMPIQGLWSLLTYCDSVGSVFMGEINWLYRKSARFPYFPMRYSIKQGHSLAKKKPRCLDAFLSILGRFLSK